MNSDFLAELRNRQTTALACAHNMFRNVEWFQSRIDMLDEAMMTPWDDWTLTLWPDDTMTLHRKSEMFGLEIKERVTQKQLNCPHEEGKGFCDLCGWIRCTGCPVP